MRNLLRLTFVSVTALALVIAGGSWQRCLAMPQPAPVPAHSHSAAHDHSDAHAAHHHQAAAGQTKAADDSQPQSDHECGKCCSLCTVAGYDHEYSGDVPLFLVSAVAFSAPAENYRDRPIDPEPGIPKPLI